MKIMKKIALVLGTVLFVQNIAGGIEINNVYASEESDNIAYTVFVSTDGREDAKGTEDDPFATVIQARDYLRTKDIDENNRGMVYIREGVYNVSAKEPTVELTGEDSYITFSAYENEIVEITGTTLLDNDKFVKADEAEGDCYSSKVRLPEELLDKVYVYNLGEEGIPVGEILKNGFNWPRQNFQPELIVDGQLQTLAQYPNSNSVMTQSQILCGKTKNGKDEDETAKAAGANEGERPRNYWFDKTDTPLNYEEMLLLKGPIFYARNGLEERISKWAPPTLEGEPQNNQPAVHKNTDNTLYETDGWLSGYFENNYANDMVRIYSVDMATQTIHCKYPSLQGVQDKRIKLKAINLLCELDTPGEYYIDRYNDNDILYYYPKGNIDSEKVQLTSSSEPFFEINNADGIVIQNLIMDGTTGNGIKMSDCESCSVISCELYNISMDAVKIGQNNNTFTADPAYETSHGGHNNIVSNCEIHDIGCGGVYLAGGNEQTLERGDNIVEHCEFYNISRLQTYTPAVYLEGVGNTANYNYIHDAPHMVIQIMGNDMTVSHNHIKNVCTNASDQAAVYSGRCFTWLGNEVSYNYFENLTSGCYAVYMDDGMSGMIIKNNIFKNMKGAAIFSNSGFGHKIVDNIFIDSNKTVIYQRYTAATRPIANEKVLTYRYNRIFKEGDGSNYTNTKENIEKWYSHYSSLYPYLSEKYLATEDDDNWNKDFNSVFVPAYQELNHMVIAGNSTYAQTASVSEFQDDDFNKDNFYSDISDDIDLNLNTGKIGNDSKLYDSDSFGKNWIDNWNNNFTLENIGIKRENAEILKGDANLDGKITLEDALITLKAALAIITPDGDAFSAADYDGDGNISISDAQMVLKAALGIS